MATKTAAVTEADILTQIIAPRTADLHPDAARALLSLSFDKSTSNRIRELLRRNYRGTITADERIALEKYIRVGQFLDLLHAKATLSLKNSVAPHWIYGFLPPQTGPGPGERSLRILPLAAERHNAAARDGSRPRPQTPWL